ncbi:hypothetical protein HMI54_004351, partial [Coelomomyces lativittatus]
HFEKAPQLTDGSNPKSQPNEPDRLHYPIDEKDARTNDVFNPTRNVDPIQAQNSSPIPITPEPSTKPNVLTSVTPTQIDTRDSERSGEESYESFEVPLTGGNQSTPYSSSDHSFFGTFLESNQGGSKKSVSKNPAYDTFKSISPIDRPSFLARASNSLSFQISTNQESSSEVVSTPNFSVETGYMSYELLTPTPILKQTSSESGIKGDINLEEKKNNLSGRYLAPEEFLSKNESTFNQELSNISEPSINHDNNNSFRHRPSTFLNTSLSFQKITFKESSTSDQTNVKTLDPKISQSNSTSISTLKLKKMKERDSDSDTSTPQQISNIISLYDNISPVDSRIEEISHSKSTFAPLSFSKSTSHKEKNSDGSAARKESSTIEMPETSGLSQKSSPIPLLLSGVRTMTSPSIASMVRELDPIAHYTNITPSKNLKEKSLENSEYFPSDKESDSPTTHSRSTTQSIKAFDSTSSSFFENSNSQIISNLPTSNPIESNSSDQYASNEFKPGFHSSSSDSTEEAETSKVPTSPNGSKLPQNFPELINADLEAEMPQFQLSSVLTKEITPIKPASITNSSPGQSTNIPFSPFKEPQTPNSVNLASISASPSIKGTPLSIRKRTPSKLSQISTTLPNFKIEYQPPISPITDRVKKMLTGAPWKDAQQMESSPTSSVSWMDDMDSADLRKEKMPFSQDLEKDSSEPPKNLQDIFYYLNVPLTDDVSIPQFPLRPGKASHIFTGVTVEWPILAFRHRSCQQMFNWIHTYDNEIKNLLVNPVKTKIVKEFQDHWNNPYLKEYLLEQAHFVVATSRLSGALVVSEWWVRQLKELKSVFERTLTVIKKDDELLSEKLISLGTAKELLEEKVERDTEINLKEKAQYHDEIEKQKQELQVIRDKIEAARLKKKELTDLLDAKKREIEQRKKKLNEVNLANEELQNKIDDIKKKKESLKFYTIEDYRKFKYEYDIISKLTGWSVLFGLKRKGRERWFAYESLIGFSYLNALKVYFEVKNGTWTLARTEAHSDSLPIISDIVDLFPDMLPPSEQELSKAARWMAHRWDWLSILNQQLFASTPKYWVTFKYEQDTAKLRIIHHCFVSHKFRVNIHLILDVWKSSIFSSPPLEYEVQIHFGKVPFQKLLLAIQLAHEERDIRAIFAVNMKVLEENN